MRIATSGSAISFSVLVPLTMLALSTLAGCPEKEQKDTTPAAEVERVEPDDDAKGEDKAKKPAAPLPAPAAAGAEDKKDEEAKDGKEEGGW